ncbi:MAG: tetratricopeptide repeat protein [Holosporales bacterium]
MMHSFMNYSLHSFLFVLFMSFIATCHAKASETWGETTRPSKKRMYEETSASALVASRTQNEPTSQEVHRTGSDHVEQREQNSPHLSGPENSPLSLFFASGDDSHADPFPQETAQLEESIPLPQGEAEAAEWIQKANAGDEDAQNKVITHIYQGIWPFGISKIDLLAWDTSFENWILEDLRRASASAVVKPQLLRDRPALTRTILDLAEQNHTEAHVCAYHFLKHEILDLGSREANVAKGIEHLTHAIERGHTVAMFHLGHMYSNQPHLEQDGHQNFRDYQALEWYRNAAERGNIAAMVNIASLLHQGRGCEADQATKNQEAILWLRKAAEKGCRLAMTNLGCMLQKGCESQLNQDTQRQEAMFWYRKAAEQGDHLAMNNLAWMLQQRHGGMPRLASWDQEAVFWYHKAAERGFPVAMNNLAEMLKQGRGVRDTKASREKKALYWYRKAAERENVVAMLNLARMLREVDGDADHYKTRNQEAITWYRKAAERGNLTAMLDLAEILEENKGIFRDDMAEACYWRIKSAHLPSLMSLFTRVARAPLAAHSSPGRSEAEEQSDLCILLSKLHEVAGEYLGLTMRHNPQEQPHDQMAPSLLPKLPDLANLYQPLFALIEKTVLLLESLEKPGILVNIICRKNCDLLSIWWINDAYNKDDIGHSRTPYYSEDHLDAPYKKYSFVSVGLENSKNAQELISLVLRKHPLWLAARESLKAVKKMHHGKRKVLRIKYGLLEAKVRVIQEEEQELTASSNLRAEQQEELKKLATTKAKLVRKMSLIAKVAEKTEPDIERIEAVRNIPDELRTVIISHLGERNTRFKREHPWVDALMER